MRTKVSIGQPEWGHVTDSDADPAWVVCDVPEEERPPTGLIPRARCGYEDFQQVDGAPSWVEQCRDIDVVAEKRDFLVYLDIRADGRTSRIGFMEGDADPKLANCIEKMACLIRFARSVEGCRLSFPVYVEPVWEEDD